MKEPKWNLEFLKNENFQYTTNTNTNKKLLLINYKADIYAAKRICENVCGKVFLPETLQENEQAARTLGTQRMYCAWIRASDSYEEGVWKDFETLEDLKFTNWGPGEPNDADDSHGGEDYAILLNHGHWNDYYYGGWNSVGVLCELPSRL